MNLRHRQDLNCHAMSTHDLLTPHAGGQRFWFVFENFQRKMWFYKGLKKYCKKRAFFKKLFAINCWHIFLSYESNIAPENWGLEDFPFRMASIQVRAVGLRERMLEKCLQNLEIAGALSFTQKFWPTKLGCHRSQHVRDHLPSNSTSLPRCELPQPPASDSRWIA